MAAKKGGLGRGLDALFADAVPVYENEDAANDTFKDTDKKANHNDKIVNINKNFIFFFMF